MTERKCKENDAVQPHVRKSWKAPEMTVVHADWAKAGGPGVADLNISTQQIQIGLAAS